MTRIDLRLLAAAALVAVAGAAAAALAADPAPPRITARVSTVDWDSAGFVPDPPYVAGFRRLQPLPNTLGSVFIGKFRQNGELAPHYVIMDRIRYQYRVQADTSATDLVLTASIPWYAFLAEQKDLPCTLYVGAGGRRETVVLALNVGPLLFNDAGNGVPFSAPGLALVDLPPGEHDVELGIRLPDGIPYALVSAGERPPPPPTPAGDAVGAESAPR